VAQINCILHGLDVAFLLRETRLLGVIVPVAVLLRHIGSLARITALMQMFVPLQRVNRHALFPLSKNLLLTLDNLAMPVLVMSDHLIIIAPIIAVIECAQSLRSL